MKVVSDIRIDFQSTPQLWLAYREGWEPGGLHGLGKTPLIALAELLEQELDSECQCSAPLLSESEQRDGVCRACK